MSPTEASPFDLHAGSYDAALRAGLRLTGEPKEYYAAARVQWLATRLAALHRKSPKAIMDFGCGIGTSIPFLRATFQPSLLVGVDVSRDSPELARKLHASARCEFMTPCAFRETGTMDLVFCNGVFHHIPPAARAEACAYLLERLAPGGVLAFWENNPSNPVVRWVMARAEIDRDASPVAAPSGRRMLTQAGFRVLRTDFLFIFPRLLQSLRRIEPWLRRIPLGGQYELLAERSCGSSSSTAQDRIAARQTNNPIAGSHRHDYCS